MFLLDHAYWEVRRTKEKGRGVFAKKIIPAGAVIGDYIGRVITPEQDDESNGLYSMYCHKRIGFFPDTSAIGIHLINHSCMPNCAIYPNKGHVLYFALRIIFPQEELTVAYMIDPPEPDETIIDSCRCICGTPLCTGTMRVSPDQATRFSRFIRQQQGRWYTKLPAPIGTILPKLASYPDHINDHPVYNLFGSLKEAAYPVSSFSEVAKVTYIRQLIRTHGRCLYVKNNKFVILGITNETLVVSEQQSDFEKRRKAL